MAGNRYEELSREITRKLGTALDRLRHVWDEIGLDLDQRRNRTEVVVVHMNNLLEEMVTEEEALRDRILKNIEKYGSELLQLCKELVLPPYEPPEGLTNVQLEKDLRRKVGTLERERHERSKKLNRLREEDQHLCDVMCTTPYYVATGAVPSLIQLQELEEHIKKLKAEKERRYTIFTSTKRTILKMLDDLEQCPNTSFERELVCEEEDSFLLTNENMTALKHYCEELEKQQKENFSLASRLREHMETLWERLAIPENERNTFVTDNIGFKPKVIDTIKKEIARCELLKLQNMKQVIESTRKELVEWWDKCYFSPKQREDFKGFTDENFTEELLNEHDDEVKKMKKYYETNEELLELVGRRQTLWQQFLEHERKAADPNRYFNRGCNLLKEEKARKKVMKELPRVEEDVKLKIAEWEKKSGRPFIISGARLSDFIARQWEEYKSEKENEKTQRHQAKAKLIEEEMMFGSRPTTTTPGKKRPIGTTPGRTPNKKFKQEMGPPLSIYNSTASSVSSAGSTLSSSTSVVKRSALPPRPTTRSAKKMNDTNKTPNAHTPGINRTGRTNYTSVYSPHCMAPRSMHKPKTPSANPSGIFGTQRVLGDKQNTASSNDTVFSQTTVSSQATSTATAKQDGSTSAEDPSLASIGAYQDFARGLNQNSRQNCRSSILPQQKPVYF